MSFSFAVAALIGGRVDAAWGRWVRPWTLAAWLFLTVGIALGSWWAYYELGWGGFWFWDPVENASLMPWLLATALLHCAIVVEKRESLKSWTILLAILAFGFSLIGTFIVRSGVLTSVHAFANDPGRGALILIILAAFVGGALSLYAVRAGAMEAKGVFAPVSRESALVLNNLLLAVSAFVVFVGTIWPLVAELLFDRPLSVGPPFFNAAFTPFMTLLALLLPIGAILPWKRARLGRAAHSLRYVLVLALAVAVLVWAIAAGKSALGPVGLFLGMWLVLGALADPWLRSGRRGAGLVDRIRRMIRLPRADWGKTMAHAGLGIVIFGISGLTAWEVEDIRVARPGETFRVAEYEIMLNRVDETEGPNYFSTMADVAVTRDGRGIYRLFPERRFYPVARMRTTEAAIGNGMFRDIYLVIGDAQDGGGWAIRTYVKPFANWIWTGAFIMALGGALSLSDRRYRVGAGARRARGAAMAAE